MYSVTTRIEFCYGHRLLDYDGNCRHLHGHNAVAEVEVRADALDSRDMVMDFGDIKRTLKVWIDREIDHRLLLRHDDPLVELLRAQGEPVVVIDGNPTAERMARLLFEQARALGVPVTRVTLWETPSSWATWTA